MKIRRLPADPCMYDTRYSGIPKLWDGCWYDMCVAMSHAFWISLSAQHGGSNQGEVRSSHPISVAWFSSMDESWLEMCVQVAFASSSAAVAACRLACKAVATGRSSVAMRLSREPTARGIREAGSAGSVSAARHSVSIPLTTWESCQ